MAKNHKKKKPAAQIPVSGKNEFMRRLLLLAKACGAESAFYKISPKDLVRIYIRWLRGIRIETDPESDIPRHLLKEIRRIANVYINEPRITLIDGGLSLSIKDYVCIGYTLMFHITDEESQCKNKEFFVEQFQPLIQAMEKRDVITELFNLCLSMSSLYSRMHRRMYWMEPTFGKERQSIFHLLTIKSIPAQKKHITIDGVNRPIYRVGWCNWGGSHQWLSHEPDDLRSKGLPPYVKIYVQSHAFERLQERIDIHYTPTIHVDLYVSLKRMHLVDCPNHGRMVEYYVGQDKVGYLPYEIKGNKMIILTFLLPTMDGTPEGERFKRKLGLMHKDVEYLNLDRLSTFACSDLKDDEELRHLFTHLGFESLLSVKPDGQLEPVKIAALLKSYLRELDLYPKWEPTYAQEVSVGGKTLMTGS